MSIISKRTIGNIWHIVVNHDPRVVSTKAPVNSIAHFEGHTGLRLFLKNGLGDTDWYNITLPSPGEYDPNEFYTVHPSTGDPALVSVIGSSEIYTGNGGLQRGGITHFYQELNTNADGQAVFNLTKDGTENGEAIFTSILAKIPSVTTQTNQPDDVPHVYIDSISADLKQITLKAIIFDRRLQGGRFDNVGAGEILGIFLKGVKNES